MNEIVVNRKCEKCPHTTGGHRLDSLGRLRCPECPQEVCGASEITQEIVPMSAFADASTIGLAPINEMSVDNLIEEIMHEQFKVLKNKFDVDQLRAMVAQIRVSQARARIYREAGVSGEGYYFGGSFGSSIPRWE